MQHTLKNRTIFCRDNLEVLRGIDNDTVDLIYLDPPFNKKKQFTSPVGSSAEGANFKDYWRLEDIKSTWIETLKKQHPKVSNFLSTTSDIAHKSNKYYLIYMAIRLVEMHRILKDTGSIYLHSDPTMSHYLKLLLDCIFGHQNFRSEIVWFYRKFSGATKNFKQNHDIILYYSYSDSCVFNKQFEAFSPKTVKDKYKRVLKDGKWIQEKSTPMDSVRSTNGVPMGNVWEISFIHSQAKERVGYPTQKPLELLERVIKVSTNEGAFVLDPFCGCATTCIAAERLNRQWVGIDVSKQTFDLVKIRLNQEAQQGHLPMFKGNTFSDKCLTYKTDIPTRTDLETRPIIGYQARGKEEAL